MPWAAIVGGDLRTGVVRQLEMLVGVYGGALVAGSMYRQGCRTLPTAFGRAAQAHLEWTAYVVVFDGVLGARRPLAE